jgi:hypothetical protein
VIFGPPAATLILATARASGAQAPPWHAVLAPLYAGDTVDLVVERKRAAATERVNASAVLAGSLPPWTRPVLGIVPVRSASDSPGRSSAGTPAPDSRPVAEKSDRGVPVAWLWPNGPATQAGIQAGDLIAVSGLQRRQGRKPAASAAAALGK